MAPKACFLLTVLRAWSRRGGVEPAGCAREARDFSSIRNDLLRRKVTHSPFDARRFGRCTSLWDANRGSAHTSPHMVIAGKMNRGPDRSADSIKVGVE
jgi:hypothetical protein